LTFGVIKSSLSQDLGQRLFHVRELVLPYINLHDSVELFSCHTVSKVPRGRHAPCRPRPLWFRFREDGSRSTAVSARGQGVDQYVPNLLHMNILLALSRNSDKLFEILKFYLNLVQNILDLEIARISR